MNDRPRRLWGVRVGLGALMLGWGCMVSGCATQSGGVPGDVSRSISDVASASQSAALSLEQNLAGRATDAVTGTTLDDMLDEVQSAATSVAELDATTPDQAELRAAATTAIRDCSDSITTAREFLSGARSGDGEAGDAALQQLEAAADRATALSDDLERYR